MTRYDLLVVGEINPDLVLHGRDLEPSFGQAEKLVEGAALTIGSSSVIMACGAARLGLRTAFVGVVGRDAFGRFMLDAMGARDVDTSHVIEDATRTTGVSVILSRGDDRAILTHLGAISALRADQVDRVLLGESRHLHVGSFFLQHELRPGLAGLLREAREAGVTTSLDTNWDPDGTWNGDLDRALAHTDVLFPNAREAIALSGTDTLDDAVASLRDRVGTLAIKLGGAGGRAVHETVDVRAPSLDVAMVDTTGAGDSFDAGFLYATLNDWPLTDAIRLACVCGSLSTRAAGGTEAQPTLAEARAAMSEI